MSTQVCLISGYGYKFDYNTPLFSFINDIDQEYDFLDVTGLTSGYYDLQDSISDRKKSKLAVIVDGMCGGYKYVMYITSASYVSNTHFGDPWHREFRNDDYIRNYCKQNIETLLIKPLGDPKEFTFEHWS